MARRCDKAVGLTHVWESFTSVSLKDFLAADKSDYISISSDLGT